MKYDDIILECLGDCEECNVYLECQYQTSSGQEKEDFLKKLLERDEAIKSSAQPTNENPEDLKTDVETKTTKTEEVLEEPTVETIETITEEIAKPETEVEAEVEVEVQTEVDIESEVDAEPVQEIVEEVVNDEESKTTNRILLTSITQEEVDKIYSEVFGLSPLIVNDETVEQESGLKQEQITSSDENLSTLPSSPIEKEEDSSSQPEKEELTPPSKEQIDAVYAEVFKLNEERPCILEEPEAPATAKEENPDIAFDDIVDEKQSVTPITQEEVDKIYSEVFNLTTTKDVCEIQPEPVENLSEETTSDTATEVISEVAPTVAVEVTAEASLETTSEEVNVAPTVAVSEIPTEVKEETITTSPVAEEQKEEAPATPVKETFKLTPPENNEELMQNMCAKRGRKLIYKPSEAIVTKTFKVLGTDKKNDVGEKVKDILDAEIKQGVKVGYLDKFDGLSSSEIKEEYENDIVYEFADQEFKKTGVIYDGKKIKVYIYDWDGKACHHVGYVDTDEAAELIPYFADKEKYSFDVCGIITGGKGKRVVKEGNNLKIVKEKGDPIGVDVDIAILNRKD